MFCKVHSLNLWMCHLVWLRKGQKQKTTKNKLPGRSRAAFEHQNGRGSACQLRFVPECEGVEKQHPKGPGGSSKGVNDSTRGRLGTASPSGIDGQAAQCAAVSVGSSHSFELRVEIDPFCQLIRGVPRFDEDDERPSHRRDRSL